jgi:hypothetical protein
MNAIRAYWDPICAFAQQTLCWKRLAANDGRSRWVTPWSQLLTIPLDGYLEVFDGPVPIRHVGWIEISTVRVRGGLAGRPREMIDITEELLPHLRGTSIQWSLRDTTWSIERVFAEEPVRVIHLPNPFGPSVTGPLP